MRQINFLKIHEKYLDKIYTSAFRLTEGSRILYRPSDHGIKNIRMIKDKERLNVISNILDYNIRYAFDEVEGLVWEEEKKADRTFI